MTQTLPMHDVIIMGGGLAGLTLALQLRQRFPDIDVLVLERRAHPVPHAAHKVGESSVEIGAHYFDTVLGLQGHMDSAQLRKFGFRFFFSEGRHDIENVTEIGASRYLSTPSYQIDRGIFENHLGQVARARGVHFVDHALVRQIALSEDNGLHRIAWREGEGANARTQEAECRWLVDACGRAGLLKRKLGLAQDNDHHAHAVWFRIGERITLDEWSQDADWRARCQPQARWLSTNHLVGTGYWVWLIPLASGSHSVGIVADPALHPLDTMDSFDKAMDWFRTWQPRLFDALDGQRHLLQDFMFLRKFSYGCKQVFSDQRWALTGEAGLFLDPFYSPGSDFIAISNSYICDLVAHDRDGRSLRARAQLYDQIYHSFYESTLALYEGQYPLFGDPEVLPVKVIWDYTYYWGVLSQIFFQERLTDLATLGLLREELQHAQQLNRAMQALLRAWSAHTDKANAACMLDQAALPWFATLNASLRQPRDDTPAFLARLHACIAQLRTLAHQIHAHACQAHPALAAEPPGQAMARLLALPLARVPVNRSAEPMLFAVD
ncbi:NAD(P)/FAD-dependent oxidoreductase [Xenophilus sp. Marseille-Q4582]|uniref:NAD(P)/FAD-dependent oxidoreductase n=1 Tax=Xenophilus sp. Marseille-Q4582 TaxID=2866600 RepID=UPI001CE3C1DB|nr:NAD(P)/FAD-dependent oxidoreductase [Xenophilus sp. Marseille-Q4582]